MSHAADSILNGIIAFVRSKQWKQGAHWCCGHVTPLVPKFVIWRPPHPPKVEVIWNPSFQDQLINCKSSVAGYLNSKYAEPSPVSPRISLFKTFFWVKLLDWLNEFCLLEDLNNQFVEQGLSQCHWHKGFSRPSTMYGSTNSEDLYPMRPKH